MHSLMDESNEKHSNSQPNHQELPQVKNEGVIPKEQPKIKELNCDILETIGVLMFDNDPDGKKPMAEAIKSVKTHGPRSFTFITDKLQNDSNINVRKGAAYVFGIIDDKRAVKPLMRSLMVDVPEVRYAAAYSLGEIQDPESIDALMESLRGDKDSNVRSCSARSLGRMKHRKQEIETLLVSVLSKKCDKKDLHTYVRGASAEALITLGISDIDTVRTLADGLNDYNFFVRSDFIRAIASAEIEISPDLKSTIVSSLVEMVNDRKRSMMPDTVDAVLLLERIGKTANPDMKETIFQTLLNAMDKENWNSHNWLFLCTCATVLGDFGDKRAIPVLEDFINKNDNFGSIVAREEAEKALRKLRTPDPCD